MQVTPSIRQVSTHFLFFFFFSHMLLFAHIQWQTHEAVHQFHFFPFFCKKKCYSNAMHFPQRDVFALRIVLWGSAAKMKECKTRERLCCCSFRP